MGRREILDLPRPEKLPTIREVQGRKPRSFYDPPAGTRALRVRRQLVPTDAILSLLDNIRTEFEPEPIRVIDPKRLGLNVLNARAWTLGDTILPSGALEYRHGELKKRLIGLGAPLVRATVDSPSVGKFGSPIKPWISLRLYPERQLQTEAIIAACYLQQQVGVESERDFTPHVSLVKTYSLETAQRVQDYLNDVELPVSVYLRPPQVINLAAEYISEQ